MKPGFYTADQLSNEDYHSGPGVSNSGLKLIGTKTPAHFWAQYRDPERPDRNESKAMMIGTALHAAALEPDKFDSEYVIGNYAKRNAAGYKAWAEAQTRHILLAHEHAGVLAMRRSLHDHPVAGNLLRDAFAFEYSVYAIDPEHDLMVRIRCDLVTNGGWIVDLKKCQDASPAGAAKAIANYGYYHQAGMYNDVWRLAAGDPPAGFAFIFVEEQYPHAVGVYVLSLEDHDRGYREYRRNLSIYAHCERNNHWPAYAPSAVEIELPYWARRKSDELTMEDFL